MARNQGLPFLVLVSVSLSGTLAANADDVHRAGIEQTELLPQAQQYVPQYGAPKMIGIPAHHAPPPPPPHVQKPPLPHLLKANIVQEVVKPPPPVVKPIAQPPAPRKEGVLPPQFLGRWQVMGSRSNVEAQQQFQQGIDGIFSMTTANTWNIQGSPEQGYMLSTDSGVSTPLRVSSQGNQAILQYQHPIKNTVAQEALVMQMTPGGVQFDGLERITIIKQGEPPRAKVTYKLIGHRQ